MTTEKEALGDPRAELRRETAAENEKGRQMCRPLGFNFSVEGGLAVGALVALTLEQPGAVI
jgi:hypothetical protein